MSMPVLLAFASALSIAFFLVPVMIGTSAGEHYILDYVLVQKPCEQKRSLSQRLMSSVRAEAVPCVEVQRQGTEAIRGPVVFATSSALLLFDPGTGDVVRIPAEGAVIRMIETVDREHRALSANEPAE